MLLLIDAGNSRLKWAIPAPGSTPGKPVWQHIGHGGQEDLPALGLCWRGLGIQRVLLSNVAGEDVARQLSATLADMLGKHIPVTWFTSVAQCAGVQNTYARPGQLGSDRFASLIGARAMFPGHNLLVVTCGTATTIDTLDAAGVFEGGMILPGLQLMLQSLSEHTAQLPEVRDLSRQVSRLARQTSDAIVSGCVLAQVGVIEKTYGEHLQRFGQVKCLIAGGAADHIVPHLDIPAERLDHLVLTGLQVVAGQTE